LVPDCCCDSDADSVAIFVADFDSEGSRLVDSDADSSRLAVSDREGSRLVDSDADSSRLAVSDAVTDVDSDDVGSSVEDSDAVNSSVAVLERDELYRGHCTMELLMWQDASAYRNVPAACSPVWDPNVVG
jgi:hypothetical protein